MLHAVNRRTFVGSACDNESEHKQRLERKMCAEDINTNKCQKILFSKFIEEKFLDKNTENKYVNKSTFESACDALDISMNTIPATVSALSEQWQIRKIKRIRRNSGVIYECKAFICGTFVCSDWSVYYVPLTQWRNYANESVEEASECLMRVRLRAHSHARSCLFQ